MDKDWFRKLSKYYLDEHDYRIKEESKELFRKRVEFKIAESEYENKFEKRSSNEKLEYNINPYIVDNTVPNICFAIVENISNKILYQYGFDKILKSIIEHPYMQIIYSSIIKEQNATFSYEFRRVIEEIFNKFHEIFSKNSGFYYYTFELSFNLKDNSIYHLLNYAVPLEFVNGQLSLYKIISVPISKTSLVPFRSSFNKVGKNIEELDPKLYEMKQFLNLIKRDIYLMYQFGESTQVYYYQTIQGKSIEEIANKFKITTAAIKKNRERTNLKMRTYFPELISLYFNDNKPGSDLNPFIVGNLLYEMGFMQY